ncbi:MAG TPA: SpoIIE family protein phosphatase, partial [Acidimicrobiales bacterium]|nr:SpoIIE family protein phosphatase [Acidimicrobiales bacterium]
LGAAAAALLSTRADDEDLQVVASSGFDEPARSRLVRPGGEALGTGGIVLWEAADEATPPELKDLDTELGSVAFVPLVAEAQRLGVACFAWTGHRTFDAAGRALIDAVARQCAVALARARHLEAEQETRQVVEFLAEMAKLVIEAADDGVFAVSSHGHVLAFNRRFCELVGIPNESVQVGAEAWRLVEPCLELFSDPEAVRAHVRDTVTRPLVPFDVDVALRDGKILSAHAAPIVGHDARHPLGRVWYVRDETDRRESEAAQRNVVRGLRQRQDSQAFLLGASEIVAGADGYRETLERLASVAVPTLADLCLVDVIGWDGRVERVAARHADPALQPLADELRSDFAPDSGGIHPAVEVLRSGRTRWSPTMSDDFLRRTTRNGRHLELVRRLGFTSYMVVPLFGDNRVLGSITLVSAGSGRRYGPRDVDLADEFAMHVAQVVANAHRNDASRRAAHTLQSSLLPERLIEVPGVAASMRYLPATVDSEVGGDFYDIFTGRDGTAYFAIGDVAGHDVTAAAIMGRLRSAARALATEARGPAELVEMLHRSWDNLEADRIATMLVAALDPSSGALELVSAGHLRPLLVAETGASFVEVQPSVPLGAPPAGPVPAWRGRLPWGATLLMFTDGLIEDRGRNLEDNAAELARVAAGPIEPKALCDRVLDTFVTDDLRRDDIALMALTLVTP